MLNFFQIFKLPETFNIDKELLEDVYMSLQRQYHPDKAIDEIELKQYSHLTASVNKAYKILSDDLERAIYLLECKGINLDIYSKDQSLLMEIWQYYEDFDQLDEKTELENLSKKIIEEKNKITNELNELFSNNLDSAGKFTMLLKYYVNLLQNIKIKMQL